MKTALLVCLFIAGTSAVVHLFNVQLKYHRSYQIKYTPNDKFSFEFLTESNQLAFKIGSAKVRKLAFYKTNTAKSIIPKSKFKRGTENNLHLLVTGNNTIRVNGVQYKTKVPLTKVVKVIDTGLLASPHYFWIDPPQKSN